MLFMIVLDYSTPLEHDLVVGRF